MAEGTEVGTAYVSIVPSAAGFGALLEAQIAGQATRTGEKAGRALSQGITGTASGVAKSVAGVFAAIGTARFLRGSLDEAQQAVKVGNLTNAVIKSTGGVAAVTAGQVEALANSLSKVAGIDDEVIQSAENVLLTFREVRDQVGAGNDIFTQATKAALDMSAAFGTDLQGSVLQLGKALNDPIQGMTALRRSGVSFTEEQQNQIKALQQSGDLLGAQKVILSEVNAEFGGASAANATALDRLHVSVKNLEESLGTALLPAINAVAGGLTDVLGIFAALPGPIQTVTAALIGISAASIAVALLAPKIRRAKEELEGLSIAGVNAGGALGFLGKAGAVAAVVGGVATALGFLGRQATNLAKGPSASVTNLASALADLGEHGQVTGELAKQFGADLGGLGHELNQFTTPKIVQSLALLNPNLQDAKRDVKAVDQALAELVSNGRPELAAAAVDKLSAAVADEGGDPAEFTKRLGQYRDALGAVNLQARLTSGGVDGVGDAVQSAADKAKEAAQKFDDLHGQIASVIESDWSKTLASNLTSALSPLDRFTAAFGGNVEDLRTQVDSAKAEMDQANTDLAKFSATTTAGEIAQIRGKTGDLESARAKAQAATAKWTKVNADLVEAEKTPLTQIRENLTSNVKLLSGWLDDVTKLADAGFKGGHETLAKDLAALGPQAAGAVHEALGLSPKQLDDLQGLFAKRDNLIGDAISGQFELNVDQAGKPGETLAEIIADRYQTSLVAKLPIATRAALDQATAAIIAALGAPHTPGGGGEPGPGEAHTGQFIPTAGPIAGPVPTAPVGPIPGPVTLGTGGLSLNPLSGQFIVQAPISVQTNANPQQIAGAVGDSLAWRLRPLAGVVG